MYKLYSKFALTTIAFVIMVAFLFIAEARAQTADGDEWESPSGLTIITFLKGDKVKFEDDDDGDGDFTEENGTFKKTVNSIEMEFPRKRIKAVITKDLMECVLYYKGTADTFTFKLNKL